MTTNLNPNKGVVLLSGGVDSSTLIPYLRQDRAVELIGLAINYGQRHYCELAASEQVAKHYSIEFVRVDLPGLQHAISASALTDMNQDVPEGHYESATMQATVVPNRNMILLSIAAGVAISNGAGFVAYAAHSGDHAIYPDCRLMFVHQMQEALKQCHYEEVKLVTPFVSMTKAQIVHFGVEKLVPYHATWSCYKGGDKHCGRCGTCVERLEAFEAAGAVDPVDYADREFYKHALGT